MLQFLYIYLTFLKKIKVGLTESCNWWANGGKEVKVFQGHTVIHSEAEPKIGAESTDLSLTVLAYSSFLGVQHCKTSYRVKTLKNIIEFKAFT